MIDRRIGKVKVRRGNNLQRKLVTFEEGELVYTTDTKRAFVGDGSTLGGNVISNKNYITTLKLNLFAGREVILLMASSKDITFSSLTYLPNTLAVVP